MDLATHISNSILFSQLPRKPLEELARFAEWLELPSGEILYHHGEKGDDLFLVANGRLHLSAPDGEGGSRFVAEVGRGESIGKVALITGEHRSVTVRAVRDSALVRIGREDFFTVLERHPKVMREVMSQIVVRLKQSLERRTRGARLSTRTLTIIGAHPGLDLTAVAEPLTRSIGKLSSALRLDSIRVDEALGQGSARTPFDDSALNQKLFGWLNDLETRYRYLLYQADGDSEVWIRRCLRQADRILVVADARHTPAVSQQMKLVRDSNIHAPVELLLLRADGVRPGVLDWRAVCGAMAHHHITPDSERDYDRVARLITGRATGVVCGGGGARGFAHLGLIRAMRERDMPIDHIGGSSMGAFIAALVATGRDDSEMLRIVRKMWVEQNNLNDYTLSRISLIRAGKIRSWLDKLFGDLCIEETNIPYFCITTNLTRGSMVEHDRTNLRAWLGASMTVPGIAPPVVFRGDMHVDGGIVNSLPADVMQKRGRGIVIASDVSAEPELRLEGMGETEPEQVLRREGAAKNLDLFKLMFRTATLIGEEEIKNRRRNADLYLRMPVDGIGMFDWEKIDTIVDSAYRFACRELDAYQCNSDDTAIVDAARH